MKKTRITSNHFAGFYSKYMKRKRNKKDLITDRGEVLRIHSLLWETVAEHFFNNIGGVYIDNIGYLCHMLIPEKKMVVNKLFGSVDRINTNGYRYYHSVLNFEKSCRYAYLEVFRTFQTKSRDMMKKGKRYRFLYREILLKRKVFRDLQIPVFYKKEELPCQ